VGCIGTIGLTKPPRGGGALYCNEFIDGCWLSLFTYRQFHIPTGWILTFGVPLLSEPSIHTCRVVGRLHQEGTLSRRRAPGLSIRIILAHGCICTILVAHCLILWRTAEDITYGYGRSLTLTQDPCPVPDTSLYSQCQPLFFLFCTALGRYI
jgi:hypothetical protein